MNIKRRLIIFLSALSIGIGASALDHFTWGIEAGTAIDLSSHDMSTLNADAFFGYKTPGLDLLGVGAGVHMMVSNSCRAFPVYLDVRTSFRTAPSLCFLDIKGGVAFNNLSNNRNQTSPYFAPSVGFNLARGKTFTSYLMFGYVYNGMKSFADTEISGGLSYVNMSLGIRF